VRASIRRWPPTTTPTARARPPSSGSSKRTPRWSMCLTNRAGAGSRGRRRDPYLNAVLAAARVKAIQGSDYSAPKLVASPSTAPTASPRAP
jgi:hypothetical protein